MEIKINPDKFRNMFAVPAEAVDRHIKLAGLTQLKVLLWIMRNGFDGFEPDALSSKLGIASSDISDAVQYWQDAGIFIGNTAAEPKAVTPENAAPPAKKVVAKPQKPTREEVAVRATQSPEVAFLLTQAEMKFGRILKQNESSTLVYLHDTEGMPPAVLLMLIEYALAEGCCTIGFIERTAVSWINRGICDVASAEHEIVRLQSEKKAWAQVCRAMGIERRKPSTKEQSAAVTWVVDWGFSGDMLRLAYDECIDNISKFSVSYINKILEQWHKNGISTPDDAAKSAERFKAEQNSSDRTSGASYDLNLIEQMLASGGKEQ